MLSPSLPAAFANVSFAQFPITAIREIKILKILNHKNVVRLKEIVTSKGSDYNQGKGSIYMVMEFLEHDLTGLTDAGQKFTVPQIKCYMKQLLEGLAYCHAQRCCIATSKDPTCSSPTTASSSLPTLDWHGPLIPTSSDRTRTA